ncbi:MAG: RNA polymerase sigma factor [Fimbriimonadaceae bacterium]|nr:RNA polymerase sigma factor [Fimbriimonadaceae bacterium]
MKHESDDARLVRRVLAKEPRASAELVETYRVLVYNFAYQQLQRRDDAEDVTQETFVKVFTNLPRYKENAKLSTWILTITQNLIIDMGRKYRRHRELEEREKGGGLEWMTKGCPEQPYQDLEAEWQRKILAAAMQKLPEKHRQILQMRDYSELEYDQIAEILNTSANAAKVNVFRARKALREIVEEMTGE